jgi:hypothetical protein
VQQRLDNQSVQEVRVSGNQQKHLLEESLKTMNLVLNLVTTCQVSLLRRTIKEDRRVQTKVMFQAAQEDEGLLQEVLGARSNNLVDLVLLLATSQGMEHHRRVDLLNLPDDSSHPHRINSHRSKSDNLILTCSQEEILLIPKGRTDKSVVQCNRSTEVNLTLSSRHKKDIHRNNDHHFRRLLEVSPTEVLV